MTRNVMEEYIEITRKQIKEFFSKVMGEYFNKYYFETLLDTYINVRYYNFYVKDMNNTYRKKILYYLKHAVEELTINNIRDRILLENMHILFLYVLYIDDVSTCKDMYMKMCQLNRQRQKILNIFDENFPSEVMEILKEYKKQKENLIKKFDTDEFYIKTSLYESNLSVYRVNLKYNINFPKEYSEYAIFKAFNTGLVNEDKLIIEYYLTVLRVINDLVKLNFKRQYIVEFASELLGKPKKIKGFLNIINSNALQDRITFKIRYEDYTKYKEEVQELMRNGYRFAIILDRTFDADEKNIELLRIFKYILLNNRQDYYDAVKKQKRFLPAILEI